MVPLRNTKLATKTLYDLVDSKPDEETDLVALAISCVFNYEKNHMPMQKELNRSFCKNILILLMQNS